MLPFQIAREETDSWGELERRLAVERRPIEDFRAIIDSPVHSYHFRLLRFLVVQLEPRRGRTLAAWPCKPRFAGPLGPRCRRICGRRAISPESPMGRHLTLTLGFRWRRDFLESFSGQISIADANCNVG